MQLKDVMEQKKVPVITQWDGAPENEQRFKNVLNLLCNGEALLP